MMTMKRELPPELKARLDAYLVEYAKTCDEYPNKVEELKKDYRSEYEDHEIEIRITPKYRTPRDTSFFVEYNLSPYGPYGRLSFGTVMEKLVFLDPPVHPRRLGQKAVELKAALQQWYAAVRDDDRKWIEAHGSASLRALFETSDRYESRLEQEMLLKEIDAAGCERAQYMSIHNGIFWAMNRYVPEMMEEARRLHERGLHVCFSQLPYTCQTDPQRRPCYLIGVSLEEGSEVVMYRAFDVQTP